MARRRPRPRPATKVAIAKPSDAPPPSTSASPAERREARTRALARLRGAREREETLASAAVEHRENEDLLAALRDILLLAPPRPRPRAAFEAGLERAPFPSAERVRQDAERLERLVDDALARTPAPRPVRPTLLLATSSLLVAAGGVVALERGLWGAAPAAAGLALGTVSLVALRRARARWTAGERERLRSAISTGIAAELERDRAEHDRREGARIAAVQELLDGDPERSRAAFRSAVGKIDLPVSARAETGAVGGDSAEIRVALHAEEEIPEQRSTLLKSGRISYRNRPKRDVREDDARAVAALCLLAGAVAFDELPAVRDLFVSAFRRGVDGATGKDADLCLASVRLQRDTFSDLKLDRLDPVAALRSLDGRFACSASFLLKPVEPLRPSSRLPPCPQPSSPEPSSPEPSSPRSSTPRATSARATSALPSHPASAAPACGGAVELAEHALALALACGRADGILAPAELEAIARAIEEHFPLSREDSRRLVRRRAAEADPGPIPVEEAARALREALSPRERQLLLDRILIAIAADGEAAPKEVELFRAIGVALDVSAPFVDGLLRSRGVTAEGTGSGAGSGGNEGRRREADRAPERSGRLGALDLPADAVLDRAGIERSLRRMEDLYAAERFRLLAPELREMASMRLDLAREAAASLLAEIPAPPAPRAAAASSDSVPRGPEELGGTGPGGAPGSGPAGTVRRDNPDLDGIFG